MAVDPRCVCWACRGYSSGSEDSGRCQSTYTDKLNASRGQSSCNDTQNDSQEIERDGPYSEYYGNSSEDSGRGQSTCTDTQNDSQVLENDGPYSEYYNSNDSEDSGRGQSTCTDAHNCSREQSTCSSGELNDSQEPEKDDPYSDYDNASVSDV